MKPTEKQLKEVMRHLGKQSQKSQRAKYPTEEAYRLAVGRRFQAKKAKRVIPKSPI